MKQCPKCSKTYSDANLNFCLEDGELLTAMFREPAGGAFRDDSPPTMLMGEARTTNPVGGWQQPVAPPAVWQGQGMQAFAVPQSPIQTMAIISLVLGIASITIGWCCSMGVAFSPAAIIVGFIALSQIKNDPQKYTGRGLAIGGIVTGFLYIAAIIVFILIYGVLALFSGLDLS